MTALHISSGVSKSIFFGALVAGLALLGGCGSDSSGGSSGGGSSSSSSSGGAVDTTPDAFEFTSQGDVEPGKPVESNTITIEGIDQPAPISVNKGEYRIDGGEYTDQADEVENGQSVTVRLTAPAEPGESGSLTLTIGDVEGVFEVTALATADGLFTGNGTVAGGTSLSDIKGMVHEDRFILFDMGKHVLYDGEITDITGETVTASTDVYKDGAVAHSDVPTTGTVMSFASLALTFEGEAGQFDSGTVDLVFNDAYNISATNERIFSVPPNAPAWVGDVYMNSGVMETNSMEVVDNESYSYTSFFGDFTCRHSGVIQIDNSDVNIYSLEEEIGAPFPDADCPTSSDPSYMGFSAVLDIPTEKGTLWHAVTNGENSVFAILSREGS